MPLEFDTEGFNVDITGQKDGKNVLLNVPIITEEVLKKRGLRIVMLGPPGSGKGTQCQMLARKYGLIHVATGELLREQVARNTALGQIAKPYMEAGEFVPDDVVIQVVQSRLSEADCQRNGWLLDGFPRTPAQAQAIVPDVVILLNISDPKVMERVSGRRYDPTTGRVYHKVHNKPEFEEVQLRLVQHPTDHPKAVSRALQHYHETIGSVLEELKQEEVTIEADKSMNAICTDIEAYLLSRSPAGIQAPNPFVYPKADVFLIKSNGFVCEREAVDNAKIRFKAAATEQVHFMWKTRPKNVLLLKKLGPELTDLLDEVARYLIEEENMNVLVEPAVARELPHLQSFTPSQAAALDEFIDFVVCLGGDGLILHVSQLFKNAVPPVISFALGSLGFLTVFEISDYKPEIKRVIAGDFGLSLRMRLQCQLYRNGEPIPGKSFQALNEVVIDRGSSPFLCNLQVYVDNQFVTTVQADGLIMATPTGSTAYSLSAGGSMMHPSVPALLFTPLCPHSLSFRPVVFPDSAVIKIEVPQESRALAWASFDGKLRQKLNRNDSIVIRMFDYPVATINKTDHTSDWFESLARCLNWNDRPVQKAFKAENGT